MNHSLFHRGYHHHLRKVWLWLVKHLGLLIVPAVLMGLSLWVILQFWIAHIQMHLFGELDVSAE